MKKCTSATKDVGDKGWQTRSRSAGINMFMNLRLSVSYVTSAKVILIWTAFLIAFFLLDIDSMQCDAML